ncbi:MAG TPA: N-6 DNA methylase [Magnetospirillaceae bacterium]
MAIGPSDVSQERVSRLLDRLGYSHAGERQWVTPERLPSLSRLRHALQQAFSEMGIIGAFGLAEQPADSSAPQFTPLVYVAVANDKARAMQIHKQVWSQGIAPFLLLLTPECVWSCNALAFSTEGWSDHAKSVAWEEAIDPQGSTENLLSHMSALHLRASLSWRDYSLDGLSRVDSRLLSSLKALSKALIEGHHGLRRLDAKVANALIGRFLYIYFLVDRGLLTDEWPTRRRTEELHFEDGRQPWSLSAFWQLNDDLDSIFNGSIFPITASGRSAIKQDHINLVRSVMRHGSKILKDGVQFSFQDFHFASLRTETLSAVYEMFFENHGADQRRDDGAFYTPPYLVDYLLAKLETLKRIDAGSKVFDGAAGSGVFLVAACRRIIEAHLFELGAYSLALAELQRLISKSVYGIERNSDACNVAAFSLYLTMLDYLDDRSKKAFLKKAKPNAKVKLFPPLVGISILNRDFFSTDPLPKGFPKKYSHLAGNPPWQKAETIGGPIKKYRDSNSVPPIDRDRADQLFFWKLTREYVADDGCFVLLLSARSFISSSAHYFPSALAKEAGVSGFVNFSHLRRKLFPGAENPTVAIFGTGQQPRPNDSVWVYSPLLSSLPVGRDLAPWALIEDRAQTERHRRSSIANADSLFSALVLRPVDRRIARYVGDLCDIGKASRFGDFCSMLKLEFKRGGSPSQAGIAAKHILSGNKNDKKYYRDVLRLDGGDLFGSESDYQLPKAVLARVHPNHRSQFSGDAIIIPRSMVSIDYVEAPFAFNSSLNSVNWERTSSPLSRAQKQLLKGVAKYLSSDFVSYMCFLFGRMWFLEGRRLEVEDFRKIPIPILTISDSRLQTILGTDAGNLNDALLDMFGMPSDFASALQEYSEFRSGFQNGKVPSEARDEPSDSSYPQYKGILEKQLGAFVGRSSAFEVKITTFPDRALAVVLTQFRSASSQSEEVPDDWAASELETYDQAGGNIFSNSLQLTYDREKKAVRFVKPLTRTHWTVERAYYDCDRVLETVMGKVRAAAE